MDHPKNATFCAAPFLQLVLNPTGDVAPCCFRNDQNLGKLTGENFREIWNSLPLQSLREEFLSGQIKTCARDIREKGCNTCYSHLEHLVTRSSIQSEGPKRLDIRMNGKCNLKCVMCSVWSQPNGYYDGVGFWESAPREVFPFLAEIEVLGGEPFIQKDTFRLIDLVSKVNSECRWSFTTNAHWKFTERIRSGLERLRLHRITVSVDSLIPEVYSRIRKQGQLSVVLRTLDQLAGYRSNRQARGMDFELMMTMVVQRDNHAEVESFIGYAQERGIAPWFIYLHTPGLMSLSALHKVERETIHAGFRQLNERLRLSALSAILQPLADTLVPARRMESLLRLKELDSRKYF